MDSAELLTEQDMPTPNDSLSVQEMVIQDIHARMKVGLERYGVLLQPGNGRDALRDAYEEAIDLAMYLRQAIAERDQAAAVPRVCVDCGRTARELIPVQDQAGRVTGWVGPTCNRRRTEAAERGAGTQLPLAQEGGDGRAHL